MIRCQGRQVHHHHHHSPDRDQVGLADFPDCLHSRVGSLSSNTFSVSSETLRDVCGVCILWVLIDSAPEPMGQNTVTTCADVPNVVVVHSTGLMEDLGSADNLAC